MKKKEDIRTKVIYSTGRRKLLKALSGIPFLGFLVYESFKKADHIIQKKEGIKKILGLNQEPRAIVHPVKKGSSREMLRIGIIGYGSRALYLALGLGYIRPDWVKWYKRTGQFDTFCAQENLNVAITGICDVFDQHAENGLFTVRSEQPTSPSEKIVPVKRYRHYREMLEDKEIDAVIIATPEHHHAKMTIDSLQAGKHVYCEKSFTRTEKETYETYNALKESNVVFQLGHQGLQNTSFHRAKEIIRKNILGKITLIELTTNRNTAKGAWIRHLDEEGNPKSGNRNEIDWEQWLGDTPLVPFSLERYYNWTKWFDYSTGLLGQLFTHDFSTLNQIMGLGIPHSVVATGGIYYWKDDREIPDVLQVVFEYPDKGVTLLYSATLASSRDRSAFIMGHDGWMKLGGRPEVSLDSNTTQYREEIHSGSIHANEPYIIYGDHSEEIDVVTSATAQYYANRGLIETYQSGQRVDTTHLHLKEWIDCIRGGGVPSGGNVEHTFEEGIVVQMAHKAYLEKKYVTWDPLKKRII